MRVAASVGNARVKHPLARAIVEAAGAQSASSSKTMKRSDRELPWGRRGSPHNGEPCPYRAPKFCKDALELG